VTAPARFTQADIDRAIKAAQRAGLHVVSIDLASGRIETSSQAVPASQLTAARDPAQRALERRAKKWSGGAG
jgi:hypothetical protein